MQKRGIDYYFFAQIKIFIFETNETFETNSSITNTKKVKVRFDLRLLFEDGLQKVFHLLKVLFQTILIAGTKVGSTTCCFCLLGFGEGGKGGTFSRVYEDVIGKAVTTGAGMLSEARTSRTCRGATRVHCRNQHFIFPALSFAKYSNWDLVLWSRYEVEHSKGSTRHTVNESKANLSLGS
jgi:hypothetical protein